MRRAYCTRRVGKYLAVARRHGDTWYVGAMTDWTKRKLELPLDFLPPGAFEMTSWSDGVNAHRYGNDVTVQSGKSVDKATRLTVELAPGGGFAAIIEPGKASPKK